MRTVVTSLHLSLLAGYSSGITRLVEFDSADNWLQAKQHHWLVGAKYYFSSINLRVLIFNIDVAIIVIYYYIYSLVLYDF